MNLIQNQTFFSKTIKRIHVYQKVFLLLGVIQITNVAIFQIQVPEQFVCMFYTRLDSSMGCFPDNLQVYNTNTQTVIERVCEKPYERLYYVPASHVWA